MKITSMQFVIVIKPGSERASLNLIRRVKNWTDPTEEKSETHFEIKVFRILQFSRVQRHTDGTCSFHCRSNFQKRNTRNAAVIGLSDLCSTLYFQSF